MKARENRSGYSEAYVCVCGCAKQAHIIFGAVHLDEARAELRKAGKEFIGRELFFQYLPICVAQRLGKTSNDGNVIQTDCGGKTRYDLRKRNRAMRNHCQCPGISGLSGRHQVSFIVQLF